MPFDFAHISNLHSKWPCQVPPYLPIQCYPLPPPHPPYFHPLYRRFPLTIHSTWIRLKNCPILIYISHFEACLPQYVEYSIMVLGGYDAAVAGRAYEGQGGFQNLLLFIISSIYTVALFVHGRSNVWILLNPPSDLMENSDNTLLKLAAFTTVLIWQRSKCSMVKGTWRVVLNPFIQHHRTEVSIRYFLHYSRLILRLREK